MDAQARKRRRRRKSHVGRMEGAYTAPGGSGKLDTRLTPVHRYTIAGNWYSRWLKQKEGTAQGPRNHPSDI